LTEVAEKDVVIPIWKFCIIEIAIPFGKEGEESSTLKKIIPFKINKEGSLDINLQNQIEMLKLGKIRLKVEFLPFNILLIDALPNK
jgi:hypothetical protein